MVEKPGEQVERTIFSLPAPLNIVDIKKCSDLLNISLKWNKLNTAARAG